jgi:prophage antirepressor-like protein
MMKNEIQIFDNPQFGNIRTVANEQGEPLFCLSDLCKVIDLTNPSSVKSRLDNGDVQLVDLYALNCIEVAGNSMANFVNESGFYDVLLQSSSPKVRPFRKWVTSEVLPAIRKSGGYMLARDDETPEELMARALVIAQETIDRQKQRVHALESEVKELVPKAEYTDKVLQSTSTLTMTDVAKELGMSCQTLEKKLLAKKVIFKQSGNWFLTANYHDKGYTGTRTHYFTNYDGSIGTKTRTAWSESGRRFVHQIIENNTTE